MPSFPATGQLATAVTGEPDLTVTDIIIPANITTGNPMIFSAIVQNQGAVPTPPGAPIVVNFYVDSVLVATTTGYHAQIVGLGTATISADGGPNGTPAWTTTGGAHTVTATVNPAGTIAESNLTNNSLSKAFTISGGASLPDLTITNVTWTPSPTVVIGDHVVPTAAVHNSGSGNVAAGVPIPVNFMVDGTVVATATSYVGGLAAGATQNITADSVAAGVSYVTCSGSANFVACGDSARVDITGDLDLIVRLAPTTWLQATTTAQELISKWTAAGNQRSWNFYIHGNDLGNRWGFAGSSDGINETLTAAAPVQVTLAAGTIKYARCYVDVDNGAGGTSVFFYTSDDGTVWTPVGTEPVVVSGVHSFFKSTADVVVMGKDAGLTCPGSLYLAQVWSGRSDGGGGLAASFDATSIPVDTLGAAFCAGSGNPGSYFSTPDSVADSITGDIDIRAYVAANWGNLNSGVGAIVAKQTDATHRSYWLALSNGNIQVMDSPDGSTQDFANGTPTLPAYGYRWVRGTIDIDDGSGHQVATLYTSTDYNPANLSSGTWTSLGSTNISANIASIFDGTQVLEVGATFVGTANILGGAVRRLQLLSGIGGTLKVDFNPTDWTSGSTWTSSATGEVWTVHGASRPVGSGNLATHFDAPGNLWVAHGTVAAVTNASAGYWVATTGSHIVNATVDPGHTIVEAVSGNNTSADFPLNVAAGAGNPDLIVTGITLSPPNPLQGDLIVFSATVANQGTAGTADGTAVRVDFTLDANTSPTVWSDLNTTGLPAGTNRVQAADDGPGGVSTWLATQGNHTVTAKVNPSGTITETDSGNNTFTVNFTVGTVTASTKADLWGFTTFYLALDDPAIYQADVQQIVAIGAGLVRFDAYWVNLQPTNGGAINWTALDNAVSYAEARNVRCLITLDSSPGWANGGQDMWHPPLPAFYGAWGNFCAAVVNRYKNRVLPRDGATKTVVGWEIWNEPNLGNVFWKPARDPVAYTNLLAQSYTSIKAADPNAVVVAGAIANATGTQTFDDGVTMAMQLFLTQMYAAGAKGHFDVLSLHLYATPDGINTSGQYGALRNLEAAHAKMVANGDGNKKIWSTESGASTGEVTAAVQQQDYIDYTNLWPTYPYAERLWFHTMTDLGGPIANSSAKETGFGIMTANATTGLPVAQKPAWGSLHTYLTSGGAAPLTVSLGSFNLAGQTVTAVIDCSPDITSVVVEEPQGVRTKDASNVTVPAATPSSGVATLTFTLPWNGAHTLQFRGFNASSQSSNYVAQTVTVGAQPGVLWIAADPTNRFFRFQPGASSGAGNPYFLIADSPWSAITDLSTAAMDTYLTTRAQQGFNGVGLFLINGRNTSGGTGTGQTFDSLFPFYKSDGVTVATIATADPTKLIPAYWTRVDHFIAKALSLGITVFAGAADLYYDDAVVGITPPFVSPWLTRFNTLGNAVMQSYGALLGNRYPTASYPNIVWLDSPDDYGGDPTFDSVLTGIIDGIKGVAGATQPHTEEGLNNSPLDIASLVSRVDFDNVYTYTPHTHEAWRLWNRASHLPVFLMESKYEGVINPTGTPTPTPKWMAENFWWSVLGGAIGGVFYGVANWASNLNATGGKATANSGLFLQKRHFEKLVPDQGHTWVTAGFGTFYTGSGLAFDTTNTNFDNFHQRPAALTSDGTLGLVFFPEWNNPNTPVTVVMSQMTADGTGHVTARWFDYYNNTFTTIGTITAGVGAPTHTFQPTGNNSNGTADWLLVLETSPV
jgi:hypothetical protein